MQVFFFRVALAAFAGAALPAVGAAQARFDAPGSSDRRMAEQASGQPAVPPLTQEPDFTPAPRFRLTPPGASDESDLRSLAPAPGVPLVPGEPGQGKPLPPGWTAREFNGVTDDVILPGE